MVAMANRTRAQYESTRLVRWILADVGRELRIARIGAGLRQADVAVRSGTSKSHVCRVEHARLATLSIAAISRHAAAVGLKPSVKLYPLGRRLLDGPQLELLKRFRPRLHRAWKWETEVPVPLPGDLRSADCLLTLPGCVILVEAFTRLSDWQAQSASAARKRRDLGANRLVLLLSATHANRRAVAEANPIAAASFPMSTKAAMAALADGRDPGTDAIVFL